jgi:hypothetical protein
MGEGEGGEEDGLIFCWENRRWKVAGRGARRVLRSDGANAGGVGLNRRKRSRLGGLYTCATSESD